MHPPAAEDIARRLLVTPPPSPAEHQAIAAALVLQAHAEARRRRRTRPAAWHARALLELTECEPSDEAVP